MTLDDADNILLEFPKTPEIDRRMHAVENMGEMRDFVHWLKLSPEQLHESVDDTQVWKWEVNLYQIETERALLLAYHQRKNMNHIPDDAELYRALTRKRRKVKWIHRLFPRCAVWWWTLKPELKTGIFTILVGQALLVFYGVKTSRAIFVYTAAAVYVALILVIVRDICRNFKKEDLCKFD